MISVGNAVFLPKTHDTSTVADTHPVCDLCGSKIYPGDTIYTLDHQKFCEECVEVTEYEVGFGA
jgi:hypothetical protein